MCRDADLSRFLALNCALLLPSQGLNSLDLATPVKIQQVPVLTVWIGAQRVDLDFVELLENIGDKAQRQGLWIYASPRTLPNDRRAAYLS
jgi:hypothetical protein